MKKFIIVLLSAIAFTLITPTLATYTTSLNNFENVNVESKKYDIQKNHDFSYNFLLKAKETYKISFFVASDNLNDNYDLTISFSHPELKFTTIKVLEKRLDGERHDTFEQPKQELVQKRYYLAYKKAETRTNIYTLEFINSAVKDHDFTNLKISLTGTKIVTTNDVVNGIIEDSKKTVKDFYAMSLEERLEVFGMFYISNDNLRTFLVNSLYSGSYPEVTRKDTLEKLYAQPYVPEEIDNFGKKVLNTDEMFIFAKKDIGNSWYVSYVFDHDEQVWYYNSRGFSVTMKWSQLKAFIHSPDSNWVICDMNTVI